jgi:uncharacterized membrane protein YgcG
MTMTMTTAAAVAPLTSLDGLITDQTNSLSDTASVAQAQSDFNARTGHQFYVVFIDSFDGMDPETWTQTTATNARLGAGDILLAVAVVNNPDFWLQYGDAVTFTDTQNQALVGVMRNSLNAALDGNTSWDTAVVNIIDAFGVQLATPAAGPGGDGTAATPGVAAPGATTEAAASSGMATWLRVVLIVVGSLIALFALWLLLGRFNEKRLAKKAEQSPFTFQ